jgi:linoleoyl-CoA desaturase
MDRPRFRFQSPEPFHLELKRRVAAHFADIGISPRDDRRMYLKSAVILSWLAFSYGLLVFAPVAWWMTPFLALSIAFAMAGIGFSVQHDANHGGYSDKRPVNWLLGVTLDLIGASSFVWRHKHNILHHTYTNITGMDGDIDFQPLLRLAPNQVWHPAHRFQHLYAWALYAIMPFYWQYWSDYQVMLNGHVQGVTVLKPNRRELAVFFIGKAAFYGWALVLPLALHPTWAVLTLYAFTTVMLGLILTTVFQLAHCLDQAKSMSTKSFDPNSRLAWAEHQVLTTVNFAPKNKLITWYLGGLNYQIEHHLFPKVCHVHYPEISQIVRQACKENEITYNSYEHMTRAVVDHVRNLRALGRSGSKSEPTATV